MNQVDRYILYAEDEETDAFLFERAFHRADLKCGVVIVPNGQAAIDFLGRAMDKSQPEQQELPALILLDINMPAVSGLEVLRWIRATEALAPVTTLMLSSSEMPADIRRAYLLGANGFLLKPSNLEDCRTMARAIADWLKNHTSIFASSVDFGSGDRIGNALEDVFIRS
jgi:CheY-like chemotaxis protein